MRPTEEIDAAALGAFIEQQYQNAEVDPDEIDTGALILTGVAVRRRNARAIGELFARQAGKMVAVSRRRQPGDRDGRPRLGRGGALDPRQAHGHERRRRRRHLEDRGLRRRPGDRAHRARRRRAARLPRRRGRIVRVEEAGAPVRRRARHQARARRAAGAGRRAARWPRAWRSACSRRCGAARRRPAARRCCGSIRSPRGTRSTQVTFSGGVSEYIYGREARRFGDLGALLAQEIRARVEAWGPKIERSNEGIRATVIGASQYTTQVSGSTIYVSPLDALPLRNVPVIAPTCRSTATRSIPAAVAAAIKARAQAPRPRARPTRRSRCSCRWRGSATFQRLDAFCQGVVDGLAAMLARRPSAGAGGRRRRRRPDRHSSARGDAARQRRSSRSTASSSRSSTTSTSAPCCRHSGAVPVVIKSLIFPASAAPGMEWQPAPRVVGKGAS